MAELFGRRWSRDELLDHVGDMSQLAGARRSHLLEGPEAGADVIELWNGTGLALTLLPGRCLDIAAAQYRGQSLCFRSNTGDLGPAFYEPKGDGWLRGFFGGLVVTCGLTFVGHAETDAQEENTELGLHGRASFLPAREVAVETRWEGGQYVVEARGRMREAVVFGTDLELERRIRLNLGERKFTLHDRVTNRNRIARAPFMLVYHTNPGFPLLMEGTRLLLKSRRTTDAMTGQAVDPQVAVHVSAPGNLAKDAVYIHDLEPGADGRVQVALVNDHLGSGLGLYWRYRKSELPLLNQWQHFTKGTYVTGIEPGNCTVLGRRANREGGTLQHLAPGESREFSLEMGILDGAGEIRDFERSL
ncbi:MAG: DUF4432 family protein [Armatimonadetes bacterium]|nr:DUF4432 family protein [Armatimonadota bacterium]